jgi:hypothetical protein
MLFDRNPSSCWPLLDRILQIKDARVCKTVKVNWDSAILFVLWQINVLLSVIWLVIQTHKHPSLRDDYREASGWILMQAKEVV